MILDTQKKWLSLIDFSMQSGLSISTLRRRIKNKKIIYKKEEGKYFILSAIRDKSDSALKLREENQKLRELISEQEMLIKIYEEKLEQKVISKTGIWGNYRPEINQ